SMNAWFFNKHTPWENEQLGCVHDFLEAELAKVMNIHSARNLLVVAHDVECGEFSIDYLTDGEENYQRQLWNRDDIRDIWLGPDTEDKLQLLMSEHKSEEDVDKGPCETWYLYHTGFPLAGAFMLGENGWLRDRAYVP
ncbi:hypothetical protein LY76DRAFT_524095, partial [Colletotrichum caudatum]